MFGEKIGLLRAKGVNKSEKMMIRYLKSRNEDVTEINSMELSKELNVCRGTVLRTLTMLDLKGIVFKEVIGNPKIIRLKITEKGKNTFNYIK